MSEPQFLPFSTKQQATEIKQDTSDIKQDTSEILGQFPISGGTDWQSRNLLVANRNYETLLRNSTLVFLDITGKGIIHSMHFRAIDNTVYLDLYIDEQLVLTKQAVATSGLVPLVSLGVFNTSLKIELKNTHSTADRHAEAFVSYSLS